MYCKWNLVNTLMYKEHISNFNTTRIKVRNNPYAEKFERLFRNKRITYLATMTQINTKMSLKQEIRTTLKNLANRSNQSERFISDALDHMRMWKCWWMPLVISRRSWTQMGCSTSTLLVPLCCNLITRVVRMPSWIETRLLLLAIVIWRQASSRRWIIARLRVIMIASWS